MRKILRDAISLKLHDALFPRPGPGPGPGPEPEPEPDIVLIQPVFNYFNYVIAHSCLKGIITNLFPRLCFFSPFSSLLCMLLPFLK